jgi:hypothetical protein
MMRAITATVASLALVSLTGLAGVSPASAAEPWWHLTSTSRPGHLAPEGEGQIVVTATNLGDGSVEGKTAPVTIHDLLPAGLEAVSITSQPGGLVNCQLKSLTCTFAGTLPPYVQIVLDITVRVKEGVGGLNEVSVSGGQTRSASVARPVVVSEEPVLFGLQDNELTPEEEGGAPDTQAGSHPFQLTNTLVLNQNLELRNGQEEPTPVALAKNINVKLPQGLVGNPTPFPRCTLVQFLTKVANSNACAAQTAVGVADVSVHEPGLKRVFTFLVPVFNLEPNFGEPARFGFFIPDSDTPVLLDPSVRSGNGEDYGITISSLNTTQTAGFLSSEITFWGVPGDPRHDNSRGWKCLGGEDVASCAPLDDQHPQSLVTLPTSCTGGPLASSTELNSWALPGDLLTVPVTLAMPALDGCNRLPFSPTIQAEPTTDRASAPSGLDFNVNFHDEGLTSPEGLAQANLNKAVVTLPEGFTINPSAGVGLGGCTPADYASESLSSLPGAGCPNDSKLGTVTIETPLLTTPIHGSLFIAQPYENPFNEPGHPNGSLVAIYIVAKNPEVGVLVKLAGKVTPNPVTGQLITTFENNPQLPFDHFNFHFREGQQAPLISPPACGTYTTRAELSPWSDPMTVLTDTSTFTITKAFDGGACPSGGVPFHPQIQSGMLNNNAGAFSPFYLHLTRTDGEQEISGFSTNLPAGLTGSLTGIPFCPEAAIALARTKTGGEEEANPSCPAASQVGHTLVGTGAGAVLAYVPGKIYLAGPFHGAPFSLVSVTSAVVGPFDLGTVVLRFGLNIDPYTAQVSVSPTTSEPIPTIIQGIVTHVRDIRVYIDRPNFTLNPTSCNPLAIASTLTANEGGSATVTSPFQAASCANLKFAPKFAVSTSGKTSRSQGASLHVDLTYPLAPQGTYADISKVKVELPKQLPSRLTTLQKACTSAQFEANPAGCPSPSVIGTAKAVVPNIPEPLQGPVYFVSHGGEAFPSLEIVLQGYGVKVILVGATFISKSGVTSTTFKAIPDNPVTSFELTLPEGPYSALAANGNLCTQKLVMPVDFTAQNGLQDNYKTPVTTTGCPKKKTLTRAQKLAAALKACHKRPKGKQATCNKSARKRYGAIKAKKK